MNENEKTISVTLTRKELELIIIGITSTNSYPLELQKEAFELILRLRDLSRAI
jgi:hypothetical protein